MHIALIVGMSNWLNLWLHAYDNYNIIVIMASSQNNAAAAAAAVD